MCAVCDLFTRQFHAAIPIFLFLQSFEQTTAIGITAFANVEKSILLTIGHAVIQRCRRLMSFGVSFFWCRTQSIGRSKTAQHLVKFLNVRLIGAATAANHAHAIFFDKSLQPMTQTIGRQRIVRLAIHHLRQSGIGQNRYFALPVCRKKLNVLMHFLRPCGAIESNHRHIHSRQNTERRTDIRAHQHRPIGLYGHLTDERHGA